jgi:hypothetical protein
VQSPGDPLIEDISRSFAVFTRYKRNISSIQSKMRHRRSTTANRSQMHQYNVGAPFERIAIGAARPFPWSYQRNRYLLIAMDYYTKWPEAYAIPNQKASMVAESLVTNFFCHFGIPREIHSEQGRNFEPSSGTGGLQRLGVRRAPRPCTRSRTA